jgi:hypothetical protein
MFRTNAPDRNCRRSKGVNAMPSVSPKREELELVNLERLAHILKGLSPAELETLELLLDQDASDTISQSLKELDTGARIPLNEW